jgi:hypothetical protein
MLNFLLIEIKNVMWVWVTKKILPTVESTEKTRRKRFYECDFCWYAPRLLFSLS